MSEHYTRDHRWVVITSIGGLGTTPYQAFRDLGLNGIYLWAPDNLATPAKRQEIIREGFRCGLGYPAHTEHMLGDEVARLADARLRQFLTDPATGRLFADQAQTPMLLDFEPSFGSMQFWTDFLWGSIERLTRGWRGRNGLLDLNQGYRGFRVTDFTPEPFKATQLPSLALRRADMDTVVQEYFGDMSHVDGWEAGLDWLRAGWPAEAIHTFVDGGRVTPPPIFYEGRKVRDLLPGTVVWNANLLREAGLA